MTDSYIIVPDTPKQNTADLREEARAREASNCLWALVNAAKAQTDPVRWKMVGGFEAEEYLECNDTGRWHPLHREWDKLRAEMNCSPTSREQHFRRVVVVACEALIREAGIKKAHAAKLVAKALATRLFDDAPSHHTIKHWRLDQGPLRPEDEKAIGMAIARCGRNPKALIKHFMGIIAFDRLPFEFHRSFARPRNRPPSFCAFFRATFRVQP